MDPLPTLGEQGNLILQLWRAYNGLLGSMLSLNGAASLAHMRHLLRIHKVHKLDAPLAGLPEQLNIGGADLSGIIGNQIEEVLKVQQWANEIAQIALGISQSAVEYRTAYAELQKVMFGNFFSGTQQDVASPNATQEGNRSNSD